MVRCIFFCAVALLGNIARGDVIQTFQITERFGANHAEQVVYFDLDQPVDADRVILRDGNGKPQPFQIMGDGRIAFRSDLPAWQSRRWTLETSPSSAAAPATDLTTAETLRWIELTNRLTGVRIAKPDTQSHRTPCPIQGVRLRDGTWTATGPNVMSRRALDMHVAWLERGPLIARVKVTYRYDRSALAAQFEPEVIPAGEGEYSCTLTLQSGEPVIGLDEYSEVDVHWSIDVEQGLHPEFAQYNGHQATSVETGRLADGSRYGFPGSRENDALVDLDYTTGRIDRYSRARFPFMSNWDIWAVNTGYYWQVYSRKPQHKNMLGIFHGRPSRIGETGVSGVAFDTQPHGVCDLDSAVGADGTVHMVYVHGDMLRYVSMDASLAPGPTIDLGQFLTHPILAVDPEGKPVILVTDEAANDLVTLRRNGEGFVRQKLQFESALGITGVVPQAWHHYAGQRHYLFTYGRIEGEEQGILLARDRDDAPFRIVHKVAAPPESRYFKKPGYFSHTLKPAMASGPDGDFHLLYFNDNSTPIKLRIDGGSLQVIHEAPLYGYGGFGGVGFDPVTADWFMADHQGDIYVGGADDKRATEPIEQTQTSDPGYPAPNRRIIASTPDAQSAVLVHSTRAGRNYPSHRDLSSHIFRREGEKWSRYDQAESLQLTWARAHDHPPSGKIILAGRNQAGRLAVYACASVAEPPVMISEFADSEKRYTGLRVRFKRLMPTQYYAEVIRFPWTIYTGFTDEQVKPQNELQGIALQYNKHSGVNITTLAPITGDYPDPPQGYGNMFMPIEAWQYTADRLRTEYAEGKETYFRELIAKCHPIDKLVLEFWREPTAERAARIYDEIDSQAREYIVNLVNGYGVYRQTSAHFMGAHRMAHAIVLIDQLLASGLLNEEQQHRLKLTAEVYADCLWNNDVVPMQDNTNINRGTHNMSSMWFNTRFAFTLMLANHPDYVERARRIGDEALAQLHEYVNEAGAVTACTHYAGASMIPIFNLMQQLQMSGIVDHFATEPRLRRFADFYMQQVTPPEVRFAGKRKVIAVGDGSTEESTVHGQLGTGLAEAHPQLSRQLMWIYEQMGWPYKNFFGSSIHKINPGLPTEAPSLGSAHFDGWCSVLRYGFETENESAVWLVGGEQYSDHRHDDNGSVVIYALGAPISIDWGSMGYPRVAGQLMHSMVTAESRLEQPWDADNTPLDEPYGGARSLWQSVRYENFHTFSTATTATSVFKDRVKDGAAMKRTVRLIHADPDHPIVLIEDSFDTDAPMIFTLNLMAEGKVDTPLGSVEPEPRFYRWRTNDQRQRPSSTEGRTIPGGLHRFGFDGQWGVDFDLFVDAPAQQQFALGNWGHTWHPTPEVDAFRRAHDRPFEESQHIFRLRGTNGFRVLLLPRRDGEKAPDVQRLGNDVVISTVDSTVTLSPGAFAAKHDSATTLVNFEGLHAAGHGIEISGGPGEVVLDGAEGHAHLIMAEGGNTLKLPVGWLVIDPPAAPASFQTVEPGHWTCQGDAGQTLRLQLKYVN